MTGPMEETARDLNAQAASWGLKMEFGETRNIPDPDAKGGFRLVTLPHHDRDKEIKEFIRGFDVYLKP